MGTGGPLAHITDWAGKLPGAIARIAALLHLMRYHNNRPENFLVSNQEVMAAIAIGNFLQAHAIEVFNLMGRDKRESGSKTVLEWLLNKQLLSFSRRDCQRALKRHFPKVDDLKPVLELLVEHHYIRELSKEPQGHRSSLIYEVNPYLYEGENKGP